MEANSDDDDDGDESRRNNAFREATLQIPNRPFGGLGGLPSIDENLLVGLPDEALVHMAKYLSKPSCALFAAAMTRSPSSWGKCNWRLQQSETSKAIISAFSREEWKVLDFADIEEELAAKLTDDDVGAVLKCIKARRSLKVLKLTGLINITGRGLRPICGSCALKQIDLSLVGDCESPDLEPEPQISEKFVGPILNSLVRVVPGNPLGSRLHSPLRHVQLPSKFGGPNPFLDKFLRRYNIFLERRNAKCSNCNDPCKQRVAMEGFTPPCQWFDVAEFRKQHYTCYECTKTYCHDCQDESNDRGQDLLGYCHICKKDYCQTCRPTFSCNPCSASMCADCGDWKECEGEDCTAVNCVDCLPECQHCWMARCSDCVDFYSCDGEDCHREHCGECRDKGSQYRDIERCFTCHREYCNDCRYNKCSKDWKSACYGCKDIMFPSASASRKLMEDHQRLVEENNELRKENEALWKNN